MNWIDNQPVAGRDDPLANPESRLVLSREISVSRSGGWVSARIKGYTLRQKILREIGRFLARRVKWMLG